MTVFVGFFFFSSRRRHTRWNCDWSSDVCSSDLPEFLRVWADLLQPGALAVLRTGLTLATMAALSLGEFVARVREHRAGRRVWRFKPAQVHRYAEHTIACPDG